MHNSALRYEVENTERSTIMRNSPLYTKCNVLNKTILPDSSTQKCVINCLKKSKRRKVHHTPNAWTKTRPSVVCGSCTYLYFFILLQSDVACRATKNLIVRVYVGTSTTIYGFFGLKINYHRVRRSNANKGKKNGRRDKHYLTQQDARIMSRLVALMQI